MKFYTEKQNTEEWFARKEGVISSSRVKGILVDKVMNKTGIINYVLNDENLNEIPDFSEAEDPKAALKEFKSLAKERKEELSRTSQFNLEAMLPTDMYNEAFYKTRPKGYFRLLAEKLGYHDDLEEDPRDRGHRLEDEAAEKVSKILGIETCDAGLVVREDYEGIGLSPDKLIPSRGSIVELTDEGVIVSITKGRFEGGMEIKSPGVVNHLEIVKTNEIPSEYWDQVIQYFVVGEVDYVIFVSYNPLIIERPIHIIRVDRKDVLKDIEESLIRQIETVKHLEEDVMSLTF